MGPDSSRDEAGIKALRLGLDLDMKFIDTAEMYGQATARRSSPEP
jgi:aryl-alcohol dehydrogenase-like predicted oxidoreductase